MYPIIDSWTRFDEESPTVSVMYGFDARALPPCDFGTHTALRSLNPDACGRFSRRRLADSSY